LLDDLRKYMKTAQPLKACSFCFGTSGPLIEHRQLTAQEIRTKLNRPASGSHTREAHP